MNAAVARRRAQRALASLLVAATVAACGSAAADGPTTRPAGTQTPGTESRAPAVEATPETTQETTQRPAAGPVAADSLLAIAETLAPPDGVEGGRTTSDGSAGVTWRSTQTLEQIQAHYERVAAEGGYSVILDTEVGGIQSWVFGDLPQAPVHASIQVTPIPGEGHLVMVTISPA